ELRGCLPVTLFFVLGAWIFGALIFTPCLGSLMGRRQGADLEHLAEIEKSEHGDPTQMKGFMGWYARVIEGAGQRPFLVTGGALAVLFAIGFSFGARPHDQEFFLRQDPDNAAVYVKARGNLSIQAMDALVRQVENKLTGIRGVHAVDTRVIGGGGGGGGFRNSPPNDMIGRIQL